MSWRLQRPYYEHPACATYTHNNQKNSCNVNCPSLRKMLRVVAGRLSFSIFSNMFFFFSNETEIELFIYFAVSILFFRMYHIILFTHACHISRFYFHFAFFALWFDDVLHIIECNAFDVRWGHKVIMSNTKTKQK